MIVYPNENFDSFVSQSDAYAYFATRLHSKAWDSANAQSALMTAYRSLQELDIVINLMDADALKAIKQAQMEQALHEVREDRDDRLVSSFMLGGVLNVNMDSKDRPGRYSRRALAILKPYLRAPVVTRTR